jgi:16S rRNA processing protein RimM
VNRVCLGVIVAAHGVRGQVKVKCFTAEPEGVAAYGELSDQTGMRRFRLRIVGRTKGGVVAQIEGVADRDAAEALKGTELHVARGALPEPEADEYYHADLIGLAVELGDGTPFGRVVALHDFGAGAMLEVATGTTGAVLMPFTREVVPLVDIAGGRLVIVPPAEVLANGGGEEAK